MKLNLYLFYSNLISYGKIYSSSFDTWPFFACLNSKARERGPRIRIWFSILTAIQNLMHLLYASTFAFRRSLRFESRAVILGSICVSATRPVTITGARADRQEQERAAAPAKSRFSYLFRMEIANKSASNLECSLRISNFVLPDSGA